MKTLRGEKMKKVGRKSSELAPRAELWYSESAPLEWTT